MKINIKKLLTNLMAAIIMMPFVLLVEENVKATSSGIAITETNFPDFNFRKYIKEDMDINKDSILSQDEIIKRPWINICNYDGEFNKNKIFNIKGVELIPQLTSINIEGYSLTNVDLSTNLNLTEIDLSENKISSIKLPKTNTLTNLILMNNNLTTIDLSNIPCLNRLNLWGNKVSKINISKNPLLETLWIQENNISTINLSNNTKLKEICMWDNNLSTLDLSNNTKLEEINLNNNKLSTIDLSNQSKLKELYLSNNNLNSLDLTNNINLIDLELNKINLPAINLSKQIKLERLWLSNNNLSVVDLTNNINLRNLDLNNNNLSTINLSNNAQLDTLNLANNNLTFFNQSDCIECLSLKNNNISHFNVSLFSNLLQLDLSHNELIILDSTNDTNLTALDISSTNISNLNLSNMTNLNRLDISNTPISSLDISNVLYLSNLFLTNTNISEINVSKNRSLIISTIYEVEDIISPIMNPKLCCKKSNNIKLLGLNKSQLIGISILRTQLDFYLTNNPNISHIIMACEEYTMKKTAEGYKIGFSQSDNIIQNCLKCVNQEWTMFSNEYNEDPANPYLNDIGNLKIISNEVLIPLTRIKGTLTVSSNIDEKDFTFMFQLDDKLNDAILGKNKVPIIIDSTGIQFNVTVPTSLPVNVDNKNIVTTASNLKYKTIVQVLLNYQTCLYLQLIGQ